MAGALFVVLIAVSIHLRLPEAVASKSRHLAWEARYALSDSTLGLQVRTEPATPPEAFPSVVLAWDGHPDALAYRIERRSLSALDPTIVGQVGGEWRRFRDAPARPGGYGYAIVAVLPECPGSLPTHTCRAVLDPDAGAPLAELRGYEVVIDVPCLRSQSNWNDSPPAGPRQRGAR